MRQVTIGIIGCGVISHTYIKEIKRLYPKLRIKAVANRTFEKAKECANQYEIPYVMSVEEILADQEIELIVNLTPPLAHFEMNQRILNAGKHLFCEKPFALTLEEANELCELAKEKHLKIGSAPDTFLGSSIQTCKKLLKDGWIGKPLYVTANMMSCGVETWHPNPGFYYTKGGGPLYDMGPYYLTALVSMFGSIETIFAHSATGFAERTIYSEPLRGQKIRVETPTHYSMLLQMEGGVLVTMNMSFDIWKSSMPMIEVYGEDGTLIVPDPNMAGGTPMIYRKEQTLARCFGTEDVNQGQSYRLPELHQNVGTYTRGAGVMDLATAIIHDHENQANERLATHVIEAITGAMESSQSGQVYRMKTSYE